MKKILTLMTALSAVAGTAMAHDYEWAVANPTVGADGFVTNCTGLSYDKTANKFTFTAEAGDKISLEITGKSNLTVKVGGNDMDFTMEDGKPTFNAPNGGNVEITFGDGTVISKIIVVSSNYRAAKQLVDEANGILDARVDNISKYVNIGGTEAKNREFYLAVRALINKEGGKLTEVDKLLEEFSKANLMNTAIGDDVYPDYANPENENHVDVEINRANGKAYIESLLNEIEKAIGTSKELVETVKSDDPAYKDYETKMGTIYVKAEEAKGKYDAIFEETNDKVKAALAEINKQKTAKTSDFYRNDGTDAKPNWVEKWTAANTTSKTCAFDLFKTYVEGHYTNLKTSALDALNKFTDQSDLDALPGKFKTVVDYSANLVARYEYEEDKALATGITNYTAIQNLSSDVTALSNLAAKGYKTSEGKDMFKNDGLEDLKKQGNNLFAEISKTDNKHTISDLKTVFTDKYKNINGKINGVKKDWGKVAKDELTTQYEAVQKTLSEYENAITTKYQNQAELLKRYQADFAAQQVELNNVKNAVNTDVNDAAKAYTLATKYNDYKTKLGEIDKKLTELWSGTQTAENQAIINANNAAYAKLETMATELDKNSNTAVARLVKYRDNEFFGTTSKGLYAYDSEGYAAFKDSINASIKTIYDFSNEIKTAMTEADAKVKENNKADLENGEVNSVLADLSELETKITNSKDSIESALKNRLTEVNKLVYEYFTGANGYVASVIAGINGENNSVKSEIEDKAKKTIAISKNTNDAACKDAIDLVNEAVTGKKDKNGKLITTENDVANAEVLLKAKYEVQTLADDVVGEDKVRTVLANAKQAATDAQNKFDTYATYKTALYDIQVAWSENRAAAATGNDAVLKAEIEKIYANIQAADKKLTETDKLNLKTTEYDTTIAGLKADVSRTVDSKTFKAYGDITTAKENAQEQIKNAKAALESLTQETAKTGLQTAIDAAENKLTAADAAFEKSLADGTFKTEAENVLKQYNSIDLTKAIEDAQKADKESPADFNGDGFVNLGDVTEASDALENGKIESDVFYNFIDAYVKFKAGSNQ